MEHIIMLPRVNLNGTSQDELEQQYFTASTAVGTALSIVQQNGPHGRDYQTIDDAAYRHAMRQHEDRCNRLKEIEKELTEILNGIVLQRK